MKLFLSSKISLLLVFITATLGSAQSISDKTWLSVATEMPQEWYGTEESKQVAENVLAYQRNVGGWPKNIPFHKPLSETEKDQILKSKDAKDAIFDNGATTTEMMFLAKMYSRTSNIAYKDAFIRGLKFILEAQYENGGWPMFYPLRKGYYTHITFNDDATNRLMKLLKEIYTQKPPYTFINDELILTAKNAWERGLSCILKTQIIVNGKPTVWCAQHDEITLLPAKARAYELPSFSGNESVGLIEILMDIESPSPEIIRAVEGAIEWLESHKLKNTRLETFTNAEGKTDRRIVTDPNAPNLWARFYDLETELPFVCDRDGIKKSNIQDISYERRNGYSWYTPKPQKLIDKFPAWKSKWVKP